MSAGQNSHGCGGLVVRLRRVTVVPSAANIVQLPTNTNNLASDKYPSAVALRMDGPWVYGALVNNVWSIASAGPNGPNARPFNQFQTGRSGSNSHPRWTLINGDHKIQQNWIQEKI